MDFVEKLSVFVNYESAYDQDVFTQYGPNGPTLDFVSEDNRNCIDLNYIHLSLAASIYDKDGRDKKKASDGTTVFFHKQYAT